MSVGDWCKDMKIGLDDGRIYEAFVDDAFELPNMCFMMLTVFLCICKCKSSLNYLTS